MSSRQRRLYEKQRDAVAAPPEKERFSDDSEEETPSLETSKNPYALLGLAPDGASSPEPEADVEEEVKESVFAAVATTGKIPKKKKRKNKKEKKKSEDEELDRLIDDINSVQLQPAEMLSMLSPVHKEGGTEETQIFALSLKSLRGDEELNRMFGAKVVASVEAELQQKRRQETGRRGRGTGRHGERRFIRNFLLTDPQPEWDARGSRLRMIHKDSVTGGELYEYVASEEYAAIHELFLECQDMGDPNALSAFLEKHPFHVEALLAMYDVLSAVGSHLPAEESLNRALFALEAVWHRKFSATSGESRLDYKIELNRPLFKALFTHIHRLSKKGCLKTAFECCKFLLSLDTSDPLGTLCMIDYLAIRAGQSQFVERLIEVLPDGPYLAIRPGTAFSIALCRHKQGMGEAALESLVQAVLMHPLALNRLMGKLKQSGARLSTAWESALQKRFLMGATDGGSASLSHLVNLFVERHHMLYKGQDVLEWLLEGTQLALDCVENEKPFEGVTVEDWICVRTTVFPQDDRNHFSHLHLYDFSDEVNRLPEDVLQGNGGDGAMAEIERRMAEQLEQHGGMDGIVQLGEEDLRNANPLIVFLRSLLPWVQTQEQNRPNQRDP